MHLLCFCFVFLFLSLIDEVRRKEEFDTNCIPVKRAWIAAGFFFVSTKAPDICVNMGNA